MSFLKAVCVKNIRFMDQAFNNKDEEKKMNEEKTHALFTRHNAQAEVMQDDVFGQ